MIQEKIKALEKELSKIDWSKEEESFNDLSQQAAKCRNAMLAKQKQASEIQIKIAKLQEAERIIGE